MNLESYTQTNSKLVAKIFFLQKKIVFVNISCFVIKNFKFFKHHTYNTCYEHMTFILELSRAEN